MDSLLETVTALASARTVDEVTRIVRNSARELTKAAPPPAASTGPLLTEAHC